MFDSGQYDSVRSVPQFTPNIFVTMAAYWAPDPPILKAFLATFLSFYIDICQ